jgi:1,2-diacylglycerol 3-beta-galactosyltransferase
MSEAVTIQLPVIVECNAHTVPQERYNASWVLQNGVGMVLSSFRQIDPAVRGLLWPGALADFRTHTAAIVNRAVFEIPDFLDQIFERYSERSAYRVDVHDWDGPSIAPVDAKFSL